LSPSLHNSQREALNWSLITFVHCMERASSINNLEVFPVSLSVLLFNFRIYLSDLRKACFSRSTLQSARCINSCHIDAIYTQYI